MECNKEEAVRAKEIAESRMLKKDFAGARKIALKAHQLYPDLDNISHMILVCDVHCSSQNKICGEEKDWYSILNIEPSADESSIKKQYRKYALSLHPDKNNFPGSTDAFKLIGESQMVLLDRNKRAIFDSKYKASRERNDSNNHKGFDAKKAQSQRQGQSGVSNDKSTSFWTLCPSCCIKYRFRADLVNRSVWCQTCKIYFTGQEIKVEATPKQKKEKTPKKWFHKKSSQRGCENFTSKGAYPENNSNGKRTRESVQTRKSPEINKNSKSFERSANVDVKTDEGDVECRPIRSTQSKLHAYYSKCSTKGKFSEQVKTADSHFSNVKDEFSEQVKTADCHFANVKDKFSEQVHTADCHFANVKDNIEKVKLREYGSELGGNGNGNGEIESRNYSHKSISEVYQYPDPDFSNFDKYKTKECFKTGDIWAVFDTIDAMPRFYALIKEVILPRFKLLITWLEPNPEDKEELIWVHEGLPVSCGTFKNGESEIVKDRLMFSHLVCFEKESGSDTYRIYPKKGETWALFKNLDRDKDINKKIEFEYVEIVSDYAEDKGIWVTYLHKEKGFSCLFCQSGKIADLFRILPDQVFRFSHRIPSFPISGEEREDVPEGSFELDPTSLPPNLEEFAIEKMGNLSKYKVNTCLDSDFNDFNMNRTEECFSVGQIWALYDSLDAMPRFYALLNEVSFSPVFEVQLTWLEPDTNEKEEIKWINEGLPASCGKFKLGNSETIEDHLTFSHLVVGETVGESDIYRIYPKKGETWALFKDWNIKWNCNLDDKRSYRFEFVEVLSDYDAGRGVFVAYLRKVEGFSCIFCRAENETKSFPIRSNDIFRFSHRVPSFGMNGSEQKDVPKGSFELDPGSLPSCLK